MGLLFKHSPHIYIISIAPGTIPKLYINSELYESKSKYIIISDHSLYNCQLQDLYNFKVTTINDINDKLFHTLARCHNTCALFIKNYYMNKYTFPFSIIRVYAKRYLYLMLDFIDSNNDSNMSYSYTKFHSVEKLLLSLFNYNEFIRLHKDSIEEFAYYNSLDKNDLIKYLDIMSTISRNIIMMLTYMYISKTIFKEISCDIPLSFIYEHKNIILCNFEIIEELDAY